MIASVPSDSTAQSSEIGNGLTSVGTIWTGPPGAWSVNIPVPRFAAYSL